MGMRPDDVCRQYALRNLELTVKLLPQGQDFPEMILIEGSEEALIFLSELVLSLANDNLDDSFSINPKGAGKLLFSEASTHGIYLHKLNSLR